MSARGINTLTANDRYIGKDVPDEVALPLILARILSRRHFMASGCIEYTGYIGPSGYGDIIFKTQRWKVHRLYWILLHGPIPEWPAAVVLHSCDNRKCINPDHLSLGTQQENIRDCVTKNRQFSRMKTHCPRGHSYAEHAHYHSSPNAIQQASPWRACKMCARLRQRIKAGWPEHMLNLPANRGFRPSVKRSTQSAKLGEPHG